jgi:hypothetical protein
MKDCINSNGDLCFLALAVSYLVAAFALPLFLLT